MSETTDSRGFNFSGSPEPPRKPRTAGGLPSPSTPPPEAPAEDSIASPVSTPADSAWEWTRQYSPSAAAQQRRKKKAAGAEGEDLSARGFAGDPAAGADADLAAMYVKPEQVAKAHDGRLTYSGVRPPARAFPWKLIFLMIFLALLLAGAASVYFSGESGDSLKDRFMSSPMIVLVLQALGDNSATANKDYIAYKETTYLIQAAYAKAVDRSREKGSFPGSIQELIDEEYLTDKDARDGWGRKFSIVTHEEKLVSWGMDGMMNTPDDITCSPQGLKIPGSYEAMEIEKETF